ncbi:MerR family transcriptional regulator [Gordonia sp. PKS22-38]|uniref:MerR family transcriptional regulator n=1 Tax=Gordonia prachuapensis TaxID=3115651 RepID=A0ABU7MYB0_9ACTN|nr:MerR family transcriptional regulator [Gordonia sp. PKS22-38]
MLIGEVARRCGVSARMLRHYDRLGLVTPTGRTSGGYREYSADDVRRLFHVESLRTLGLSLEEVAEALAQPQFSPDALVTEVIRRTRERIASEQELLRRLEWVEHAAPADWTDVVRVVTQARALESESGARRQQAVLSPTSGTSPAIEELVRAVLSEDDPNVAGALRWAITRAGGQGLSGLARGLVDDDVAIRRRALAAIVAVDHPDVVALLRRALDDPDDEVSDRSAVALAHTAEVDAITRLVAMVVDGRRDVEAAEALGRLAEQTSADIVATLQEQYDMTPDPAARLRITQALAEIPVPRADPMLSRLLADTDPTVAATAGVILDGRPTST